MTQKGLDFESIYYLEEQLSAAKLRQLLHSAGLKPQDAIRTNEPAYRLHIGRKQLTDSQLIELMARHPELIQRPIVVSGKKAVLARPVEKLGELGIK